MSRKVLYYSSIAMSFLFQTNLIASDLNVDVVRQSDWDSGFCANVIVSNPSDEKQLWNISFDAEGIINNLWNANYSQDQSTLITTASGVDWNKYVEAHSNVTFGYCANKIEDTTISTPTTSSQSEDLTVTQTDNSDWGSGFCKNVQVKNNTSNDIDWEVNFDIDGVVYNFWNANLTQDSQTLKATAGGVDWNNIVKANSQVEFGYCANRVEDTQTNSTQEEQEETSQDNNTPTEQNTTDTTQTDTSSNNDDTSTDSTQAEIAPTVVGSSNYLEVLPLSLKFYEAQRASGPFPTVTWRKAGGLSDGQDVGRDLSGGWFDAGDHVKFNLPMSYSASMLNWGIISFPNSYVQTNSLEYAKDQVKYALDYFIQAYNEGTDPNSAEDDKVYYQVGDPYKDHAFWGPPELMTMERPTYTCDSTNKCSEVAGDMAAALASGAIVFSNDANYSSLLLDKAKKLYKFAEEYQGNNGYTAANNFYTSFSGYNDELSWGAIWLYLATGDNTYLDKAKTYVAKASDSIYWTQNWDNVSNGTNLLLAQITNEQTYKDKVDSNLNYWLNNISYTTGGLAFLNQWGSLRYASSEAFMALLYSKGLTDLNRRTELINFAKSQINYILGENPRNSSYVVGYGNNAPINPHHRASHNSQTNDINSPANNEFTLEGALVGGPKSADDFDYADDRTDYVANEVATDYNAGFVGALAGLIELTISE